MSDFALLFTEPTLAAMHLMWQVQLGAAVTSSLTPEIASGEIQLVPSGQKTSLKELLIRTYADLTGTPPSLVAMARGSDTDEWFGPGDPNGTIAVSGTVTGTGTAWSHTIAVGDGAHKVYTTPCAAVRARVYLDGTLTAAYTVTGLYEITFAANVTAGVVISCYWPGWPHVVAKVGDVIQVGTNFSRIATIPTATSATLENGGLSGTGILWTSFAAPNGEGEVRIPLTGILDTLQYRLIALPADTGGVVNFKFLDVNAVHVPSDERQYRES